MYNALVYKIIQCKFVFCDCIICFFSCNKGVEEFLWNTDVFVWKFVSNISFYQKILYKILNTIFQKIQ
jgi:hypothetical protein